MNDQEKPGIPTVQKKTLIPPGVLPRQAQTWFIGGVAVLMVLIIAFTGGKSTKAGSGTVKPPIPQPQAPSEVRIQEYRERIEEQARKLAEEQARLAQTKADLGVTPNRPSSPEPGSLSNEFGQYQFSAPRQKSWLETDVEKREYLSRYASNIALSYRETPKSGETTQDAEEESPRSDRGKALPKDSHLKDLAGPDSGAGKLYRLFEGTIIETVLTNRLDGTFSGPVNCMVTTNVFSHNRQHLLIPQGTRVLGEVKHVETFGQKRLAVLYHRMIMPDGYSVNLDQFQGLNQIGETGLTDQLNHHYLQVFGASLAIGALAGFSQANTRSGLDTSAEDAYRQGAAASLSQSSLRILDRYLNVLPTITIREGHRIKIYLAGDLQLPAYENHPTQNVEDDE